jgi:heme/copper-type cytochrome/quinol oxidase subunit 1
MAYIIKITRLFIAEAGWTIYPPLSANMKIYEDNGMKNILHIGIGMQILLIIALIWVAVKTVINMKKAKADKI